VIDKINFNKKVENASDIVGFNLKATIKEHA
jgi:hypothetical protein